jgi:hypothetical protein
MNSHILSKLTIFAAAFVINGLMFAGVNYLFNGQMHRRSDWVSLAQADGESTAAEHAGMLIAGDHPHGLR